MKRWHWRVSTGFIGLALAVAAYATVEPLPVPQGVPERLIVGHGTSRESQARRLFFYKFTSIADTKVFPFTNLPLFPAINSSGRIAFGGTLVGGVEGMFTRVGTGGINTLADTGLGEFRFFSIAPSINSAGTVLFLSQLVAEPGNEVLLRGSGNSATKLLDSGGQFFSFGGVQINDVGTAVVGARRDGGGNVVLTAFGGQPTVIVEEGPDFSSIRGAPSLNNLGTVAFVGTRVLGGRGIFTRKAGQTTVIAEDSGQFAGFDGVAINEQGAVAFTGVLDIGVRGVFRISGGTLTTIASTIANPSLQFGGFSINDSSNVAYEVRSPSGNAIVVGPNSLFGRVIGTGDVLFGRTVNRVLIDRDSFNNLGQLAVHISFTDGSQMIARGDPVRQFDTVDPTVVTQAVQMTTGGGTGASVGTLLPNPRSRVNLSFDVRFLSAGGELQVKLDDVVVQSIPAADLGVRTRVQIPLDLRSAPKGRAPTDRVSLQFAVTGKPGATVQIGDVSIPGLLPTALETNDLSGWTVDTSSGGTAAVVDTTRFPVKIVVQPGAKPNVVKPGVVSVAILSSKSLDAPEEIERSSIRLAQAPVRMMRDKEGKEQPACEKRDVSGDKLADLVCDVELRKLPSGQRETRLVLEAETRSGLRVTGSDSVRIAGGTGPPY
ncbi:MAG: choice-of-anchor tandem repeat NxxGxxAF-containing protein [Pyrinomonadaceae bacterium]